MNKSVFKMAFRSIKASVGRYIAILAIVTLSVGFFAGLKITKDAMSNTYDDYVKEQNFYDFRLVSRNGFTEDGKRLLEGIDGIEYIEASKGIDAVVTRGDNQSPYKIMAVPQYINKPALKAGRLPQNENECLVDAERFSEHDLGKTLKVSDTEQSIPGAVKALEYEIVGVVDSPLYVGIDRGTTTIGTGKIATFIYVPEEAFNLPIYTDIYISIKDEPEVYSKEYDNIIKEKKKEIEKALPKDSNIIILTRNENKGYVSFESDTSIVSGIANMFPLFFILIALLVCVTTMTRMVDEERTQIGMLKANGYGVGFICSKYFLYAGSATVLGWLIGFFAGIWALPKVFWFAYSSLYDFADIKYMISPELAIETFVVSVVAILGSVWLSCKKELLSAPAMLMRPKAPKIGKAVIIEKIKPVWSRLSFIQKVSIRNVFRYKGRLIMLLAGIGCCTGLVLTAFGVGDSMIGLGSLHFKEVQHYDMQLTYDANNEEAIENEIKDNSDILDYKKLSISQMSLSKDKTLDGVNVMCTDNYDNLDKFWSFKENGKNLKLPEKDEILISEKIADKLEIELGDYINVKTSAYDSIKVKVTGIFDNYVFNNALISVESYKELTGDFTNNNILLKCDNNDEVAKKITKIPGVTGVSHTAGTRRTVDDALDCLKYIVVMIIAFCGALAFVVIYNLTNINLAERSREVATVKVLGFYKEETESYILRENIIISVIAGIIGLPIGVLFHKAVMSMILIDNIQFNSVIKPQSYIYAFVCMLIFVLIVNIFMKKYIDRIKMAESLKAVE